MLLIDYLDNCICLLYIKVLLLAKNLYIKRFSTIFSLHIMLQKQIGLFKIRILFISFLWKFMELFELVLGY